MRACTAIILCVLLAACAAEAPRRSEVLTVGRAQTAAPVTLQRGLVWRLDPAELNALSPTPMVEAPPPPRLPPPPRPNDPPAVSPYYGSWFHWGPGFHDWPRH